MSSLASARKSLSSSSSITPLKPAGLRPLGAAMPPLNSELRQKLVDVRLPRDDIRMSAGQGRAFAGVRSAAMLDAAVPDRVRLRDHGFRSEEHTSELQS